MDVANTAVDMMSSRFIFAALQRADDQWAYLSAVLKRELIQQAGGYFRADADDDLTEVATHEPDALTPILEAIQLTTDCLTPLTPEDVLPHLKELIYYFAEHGHANLSRLHTTASRDPELLALDLAPRQILAVANVVLGSRPNHGDTSILGAFIQDRDWKPDLSPLHMQALAKYGARITSHSMGRTTARLAMVS